jgi:hypothetical protein
MDLARALEASSSAHEFQIHRLAGTSHMRTQIDRVIVRTLGIASLLLMPVSGAMADGAPMNGGMMGNGSWYGAGGAWLPVLVVIILGTVLYLVLRKKN